MKKLLTLVGAAFVFSSSFAMAAAQHHNPSSENYTDTGIFQQLDANADGVVTKQETNLRVSKRFTQLDLDNNGVVTKSEFNRLTYNRLNNDRDS